MPSSSVGLTGLRSPPTHTHTHTHTHSLPLLTICLVIVSNHQSVLHGCIHAYRAFLAQVAMLRAELIMVGGEDRSLIPAIYLHYLSLSLSLFIYTRARAHTHTHTHTHTHRSLLPAHLRRQQLADKESLDNGDADDESWWEKVQDLELNNRHLRKLSNLERLVNLKVLSVCDNEILAIQGLERWVACVRSRRVCLGMCVCVCVCVCVVRIIRCHRCAARTWASICLVCAHPRTGRARAHTHTHTTPRMGVCSSTHACAHSNTCIRTAVCCWRSY